MTISGGFVSSKIYDKRDDFDFDIVNFPFLDGDIRRATSYGVYISQLIHVADFNTRNQILTVKLLITRLFLSTWYQNLIRDSNLFLKKVNIKVQGVPQSQTAANPRHQEEEKNDKN